MRDLGSAGDIRDGSPCSASPAGPRAGRQRGEHQPEEYHATGDTHQQRRPPAKRRTIAPEAQPGKQLSRGIPARRTTQPGPWQAGRRGWQHRPPSTSPSRSDQQHRTASRADPGCGSPPSSQHEANAAMQQHAHRQWAGATVGTTATAHPQPSSQQASSSLPQQPPPTMATGGAQQTQTARSHQAHRQTSARQSRAPGQPHTATTASSSTQLKAVHGKRGILCGALQPRDGPLARGGGGPVPSPAPACTNHSSGPGISLRLPAWFLPLEGTTAPRSYCPGHSRSEGPCRTRTLTLRGAPRQHSSPEHREQAASNHRQQQGERPQQADPRAGRPSPCNQQRRRPQRTPRQPLQSHASPPQHLSHHADPLPSGNGPSSRTQQRPQSGSPHRGKPRHHQGTRHPSKPPGQDLQVLAEETTSGAARGGTTTQTPQQQAAKGGDQQQGTRHPGYDDERALLVGYHR